MRLSLQSCLHTLRSLPPAPLHLPGIRRTRRIPRNSFTTLGKAYVSLPHYFAALLYSSTHIPHKALLPLCVQSPFTQS
ncbi:hypothetical protein BOTBODRAFT_373838 [Botryobasidium botryosum FD-172 SS1]|uniref:Uncharacterized protein n=1 Tax=Botryobasidium botryosum (strain FD-172 SS1) TaxID=930990 RepID=A0A067MNE4_BOTB1|nr:hypothetical protein BOTBODRAFT_373838 [Botryobasidium botryosum FD-172 SS1]